MLTPPSDRRRTRRTWRPTDLGRYVNRVTRVAGALATVTKRPPRLRWRNTRPGGVAFRRTTNRAEPPTRTFNDPETAVILARGWTRAGSGTAPSVPVDGTTGGAGVAGAVGVGVGAASGTGCQSGSEPP